jgi:hypothetical protein
MYSMTIQFIAGVDNKITIEADGHSIIEPALFSVVGSDKRRYLIPLSNIAIIEFDDRLGDVLQKNSQAEK